MSGTETYGYQLVADIGHHRLHSADTLCVVPCTQSGYDRLFNAMSPKLWNGIRAQLCQQDVELGQFKRLLEMFLFCNCSTL